MDYTYVDSPLGELLLAGADGALHLISFPSGSSDTGLSADEVAKRLEQYGANTLPAPPRKSFLLIFFRQFLSPLIYVLLLAAVLSLSVANYWKRVLFLRCCCPTR